MFALLLSCVAKNTVTVCCYYRVVCGSFVLQTCVFWSGIPDYTGSDLIAKGRVLFMTVMFRCILIATEMKDVLENILDIRCLIADTDRKMLH